MEMDLEIVEFVLIGVGISVIFNLIVNLITHHLTKKMIQVLHNDFSRIILSLETRLNALKNPVRKTIKGGGKGGLRKTD
jgi:uncharacterized protein YejL (UPF0352 family)